MRILIVLALVSLTNPASASEAKKIPPLKGKRLTDVQKHSALDSSGKGSKAERALKKYASKKDPKEDDPKLKRLEAKLEKEYAEEARADLKNRHGDLQPDPFNNPPARLKLAQAALRSLTTEAIRGAQKTHILEAKFKSHVEALSLERYDGLLQVEAATEFEEASRYFMLPVSPERLDDALKGLERKPPETFSPIRRKLPEDLLAVLNREEDIVQQAKQVKSSRPAKQGPRFAVTTRVRRAVGGLTTPGPKRLSQFEKMLLQNKQIVVGDHAYNNAISQLEHIVERARAFKAKLQTTMSPRDWATYQKGLKKVLATPTGTSGRTDSHFPDDKRVSRYRLLLGHDREHAELMRYATARFSERESLRSGGRSLEIAPIQVKPAPRLAPSVLDDSFDTARLSAWTRKLMEGNAKFASWQLWTERLAWLQSQKSKSTTLEPNRLALTLPTQPEQPLPSRQRVADSAANHSSHSCFDSTEKFKKDLAPARMRRHTAGDLSGAKPGTETKIQRVDLFAWKDVHIDFSEYDLTQRNPFSSVGGVSSGWIPYRLMAAEKLLPGLAPHLVPIPFSDRGHRLSRCGHWLTLEEFRAMARENLGQILVDGEASESNPDGPKTPFHCPECRKDIPSHEAEAALGNGDFFRQAFGFAPFELVGTAPKDWPTPPIEPDGNSPDGWSQYELEFQAYQQQMAPLEAKLVAEAYASHWQSVVDYLTKQSARYPWIKSTVDSTEVVQKIEEAVAWITKESESWTNGRQSFLERCSEKIDDTESSFDKLYQFIALVHQEETKYATARDNLVKGLDTVIQSFEDRSRWMPLSDFKDLAAQLRNHIQASVPNSFESPNQHLGRCIDEINQLIADRYKLEMAQLETSEAKFITESLANLSKIGECLQGKCPNRLSEEEAELLARYWLFEDSNLASNFGAIHSGLEAHRKHRFLVDTMGGQLQEVLADTRRTYPEIPVPSNLVRLAGSLSNRMEKSQWVNPSRTAIDQLEAKGPEMRRQELTAGLQLLAAGRDLMAASNYLVKRGIEPGVNHSMSTDAADWLTRLDGAIVDIIFGDQPDHRQEFGERQGDFSREYETIGKQAWEVACNEVLGPEKLIQLPQPITDLGGTEPLEQPLYHDDHVSPRALWTGEYDVSIWSEDPTLWLKALKRDLIPLVQFASRQSRTEEFALPLIANINAALLHVMQSTSPEVWKPYLPDLTRWEEEKNRFLMTKPIIEQLVQPRSSGGGDDTFYYYELIPALPVPVVPKPVYAGSQSAPQAGLQREHGTTLCYFNSLMQLISAATSKVDLSPVNLRKDQTWLDPIPDMQRKLWNLVTLLRIARSDHGGSVHQALAEAQHQAFSALTNLPDGHGYGDEKQPADPLELLTDLWRAAGHEEEEQDFFFTNYNSVGEGRTETGCQPALMFDPRLGQNNLQQALDSYLTEPEMTWSLAAPTGARQIAMHRAPQSLVLGVAPSNESLFAESPALEAPILLSPPVCDSDGACATRPGVYKLRGALLLHRKFGELDHYTAVVMRESGDQDTGRRMVQIHLNDGEVTTVRGNTLRDDPEGGVRIHTLFYER